MGSEMCIRDRLDIDGLPVLVDSGTFLYYSGGSRRTALRESLAHNTLCVAGASQSVAAPGFGWLSRANCVLSEERPGPVWSVAGRHDGYQGRFGVLHERRVRRVADGFELEDRLDGATSPLAVEIRFLLNPTLRLAESDGAIVALAGDVPLCRFRGPAGFNAAVLTGSAAPQISTGFGLLARGLGIVFSGWLAEQSVSTRMDLIAQAAPR